MNLKSEKLFINVSMLVCVQQSRKSRQESDQSDYGRREEESGRRKRSDTPPHPIQHGKFQFVPQVNNLFSAT